MIISELNYIESLDLQLAEISGGQGGSLLLGLEEGDSIAEALAAATAIGNNAIALTATSTTAVPGGASSASSSLAISG